LADLKEILERHLRIEKEIKDLKELFAIAGNDFGFFVELEKKAADLEKTIGQEELKVFLSGKYDTNNALLSIMAGAGGQDSEDWATLLLRMYQRYGDRQGWRARILEQSFGEAGGPEGRIGTKSVTLEVKGKYAYGFLRGEAGVHRLVRLSPFSSQALRHTSFAKVEVMPEIEDEKAVEIRPEDLKIDFYRASGPGGQNVNKRETSVRITHLPTAIVVACQVERSQGDNRKKAMAMLASKLIQLKEGKRETEIKKVGGDRVSASWGNQIRSYVLHPYKMVKDLRTEVESSNPDDVLDGNLDKFITAELKIKK
jgi:peptide chain release factor 2